VNVIWDLAPHDVSILNILERMPESVATQASCCIRKNVEDVALSTSLPGQRAGAHHVAGSTRTDPFDHWWELEDARVRRHQRSRRSIYDTRVTVTALRHVREFQPSYRYGDILIRDSTTPSRQRKPAGTLDCVERACAREPGVHGLEVVRVPEAADASIREGGRSIDIGPSIGARRRRRVVGAVRSGGSPWSPRLGVGRR
jgi:hypothetical protein